jgi:hypothetical protein
MSKTKAFSIVLAIIVIGGGVAAIRVYGLSFAILLSVFVSLLLGALPLLISYVQATARDRQLAKLESISKTAIADTAYYKIAVKSLESIRPATVIEPGYRIPIASFAVVVVFGCLMVLLGGSPESKDLFKRTTFLLGGLEVMKPNSTSDHIVGFQMGTLLVGSFAFIGAYIYVLARLLSRVNNNDIYPISYYYYIARFVTAVLVAMILRHLIGFFLDPSQLKDSELIMLLLGFAIGFSPDLFIFAILRRAYQFVKIPGGQNDPDQNVLPTNMSLLMIEGLTRDKIDRLTELDIDNAQILANQNPFIIWPRLPYSLTLIVDWIAQAQLYDFSKETAMKALRAIGINNIYDLHAALSDAASAQEIAKTAGLCGTAIAAYIVNLAADPSFRNLKEVRDKL